MNHTPEQISEIVLKVLKEVNEPDVFALSSDGRLRLAENPNTSAEVLAKLATDGDFYVRSGVAWNPNYAKAKTLELSAAQHEALKVLLKSSQDESLKTLAL